MSGVKHNGHETMKGAVDAVARSHRNPAPGSPRSPPNSGRLRRRHPPGGRRGRRSALGIIYLKDTVKPGMRERFDDLRAMGIQVR